MMVQYLLDTDADGHHARGRGAHHDFDDVLAPVALALDQEKRVTEQINGLLRTAREEMRLRLRAVHAVVHQGAGRGDRHDERPADVVERTQDDINNIEDYVAREQAGDGADPTAPRLAGA